MYHVLFVVSLTPQEVMSPTLPRWWDRVSIPSKGARSRGSTEERASHLKLNVHEVTGTQEMRCDEEDSKNITSQDKYEWITLASKRWKWSGKVIGNDRGLRGSVGVHRLANNGQKEKNKNKKRKRENQRKNTSLETSTMKQPLPEDQG